MDQNTGNKPSENILVIKSRFKSIQGNIFGQMIIFLRNKELESVNAIVSTYSDVYKIDLSTEWDKYEEMIADLKWKGQFNNNLTTSLSTQISNYAIDRRMLAQFYQFVYNYDYKSMENILFDQINRIVHDKDLSLETVIQEVSASGFSEVRAKRSRPKETADKGGGESQAADPAMVAKIIPIDLILSPVKGKPIYSIKIGDRLMIKIKPASDRANYIIDEMGLKKDKEILPIPAEVIDIKAGQDRKDPVEILTKIIPGIFGKGFENERSVKLRMYDPHIDEDLTIKKPRSEGAKKDSREKTPILSRGFLVMALLLIIIITLLLILILGKW